MNRLLTFIFLGVSFYASAQLTERKTTVNGQQVAIHLVQKGETVYGLSRTYDVPAADLLALNPKAKNGLNIGDEFYVPVKQKATQTGRQHTVKAGETLYAISRQYNVDVNDIKKANTLTSEALNVGQVLVIPGNQTQTTTSVPVETVQIPAGESYIVQKGETLFAISRKTGVSVDKIMEWNGLKDGNISEGQQLRIKPQSPAEPVKQVVTDNTQEVKQNVSNADANKANSQAQNASDKAKENAATNSAVNTTTTQTTQKTNDQGNQAADNADTRPTSPDQFVEVQERGVAELIPDTDNTRKYLALHRTVKPGTVIRVRNEINDREVWARVIGPLPDTSENADVLIKISKAAYDRLGALDKKFRVTITYIP